MMADVDLGLKILDILSLEISDKMLMVIGDEDIGSIPDTLTLITQVNMVDC